MILEPNCFFVANNPHNRKAAWNFHYNKNNYQKLIYENCPLELDRVIGGNLTSELSSMEVEYSGEGVNEEDYWSISKTVVQQNSLPSVFDLI